MAAFEAMSDDEVMADVEVTLKQVANILFSMFSDEDCFSQRSKGFVKV